MSQEEKKNKADIIIYNNGSLDNLKEETKKVINKIVRRK